MTMTATFRRFAALPLSFLVGAICAVPAYAAPPVGGRWSGTTSQGLPVIFGVSSNGRSIVSKARIRFNVVCEQGGVVAPPGELGGGRPLLGQGSTPPPLAVTRTGTFSSTVSNSRKRNSNTQSFKGKFTRSGKGVAGTFSYINTLAGVPGDADAGVPDVLAETCDSGPVSFTAKFRSKR